MKRSIPSAPRGLLGVLCAALMACAQAPVEEQSTTHVGAITQGALAPDDHAVVALLRDGNVACTGTLISPLVVITARHCIPDPAGAVQIGFGVDPATAEHREARVHWLPASVRHDVGLILLDSPAPEGVAPAALPSSILDASVVNAPIRLVGFGKLAADDQSPPQRRTGTAKLAAVNAFDFDYTGDPSQACVGDSGGPTFRMNAEGNEEIIGVTSSGDEACIAGGSNARLDLLIDNFIQPFIDATVPGSATRGALCFGDDTCTSGSCHFPEDAPTFGYCTAPCANDDACTSPMSCVDGQCEYPLPSPGATGAACLDPLECISRLCKAPTDDSDSTVCTNYCANETGTCPSGTTCRPIDGQAGVSACFPIVPGGSCAIAAGRRSAPVTPLFLVFVAVVARRPTSRFLRRRRLQALSHRPAALGSAQRPADSSASSRSSRARLSSL